MSAQAAIVFDDSRPSPAPEEPRATPHLCVACHERPARFQYRGVVKADRTHTLCFRCYRSMMDSIRNVEPVGRVTWVRSRPDAGPGRLMGLVPVPADKYVHLARRRCRAQIAARHALEAAAAE